MAPAWSARLRASVNYRKTGYAALSRANSYFVSAKSAETGLPPRGAETAARAMLENAFSDYPMGLSGNAQKPNTQGAR